MNSNTDYPAPGFRDHAGGALRLIGHEGTAWSASADSGSTNAWRLLFNAVGMYPSHRISRACGFQLRCLSE